MKSVVVLIGAGQIGQAIARRVGIGKHVLLADMRQDNADAAAEVLGNAGYDVSVATGDASFRRNHAALRNRSGRQEQVRRHRRSRSISRGACR